MKAERITRRVYQWQPTGKRSRERPSKRWMDGIEKDLRRAGVTKFRKACGRQRITMSNIAEDREQWRELLAASLAESRWTMKT